MVSEMKIIFFLISIISTVTVYCHTGCSPVYGSEPCAFLPAPPGKTPSCALHGLTYCEHPDHYPGRLENNYQRLKRSLKYKRSQVSIQERFEDGRHSNSTSSRIKRQSPNRSETLCRTRSQYIMPRAALNNKGNWMYVVNMPEVDNQYTQLVKSETCVSEVCSGICSLPQGYSSRCEQKYIQKRLVALEEGGNQLYTDLFWIPSCCVCTISSG
nr:protein spaetzle 5-like [Leptinotarsa decemlineata]